MRDPFRVLVLTVVHDPEDARIRHRQIPALLDAGFEVAYAAPFSAFNRTPPEGVRGVDVPRAQGRARFKGIQAARRVIHTFGATTDVILLHDPDLLLSAFTGHTQQATVVWDVHEDTAAALSMRDWVPDPLRPLLQRSVQLGEKLAESRYHLLLAEHGYQDRFAQPHPVVPNSVRVPEKQPPASGNDRIVYLGKITRPRGGFDMIELARKLPEFTVEIIGPAESDVEPALREAHEQGVINWLGFQPNSVALPRLYGALAGLSMLHDEPNYAHSQPTKVIEYMAHGIPVITTPNKAPKELVTAAQSGAVIPFGDIDAAATHIRQWAADEAERSRLAQNGYHYADTHLNWNRDALNFVASIRKAREADLAKRAR